MIFITERFFDFGYLLSMDTIIEKSCTHIGPDETVIDCINPWVDAREIEIEAYADCFQCGHLPFRILIIQDEQGKQRGIQLCGRHFIEVRKSCEQEHSCKLVYPVSNKVH